MIVLWFSNTPANGSAALDATIFGGGWLKSLDLAIQDDVELHVAFYYPKKRKTFKVKGTTYHPIVSSRLSYLKIIFSRIRSRIEGNEHLEKYRLIIEKVKPDIIHIHGTENPFGFIIPKTKLPTVISIQGIISVCAHKFFSGIKPTNVKNRLPRGWRDLFTPSFNQIFRMFQRMVQREETILRSAKYVLGRTDWDRRVCSILAPSALYFHSNEVLSDSFYLKKWNQPAESRPPGKLIIHTTNGNSPYKGFETICHALALLNGQGVEAEWRVAGVCASDSIVTIVKRQLKKDFPSRGLVFLGRLPPETLLGKLLEADLYVMPSHIENSPNNLCEAMILGMPCIATAVGGTSSILRDGVEGLLVPDGDPWAMAGAIVELYKDPERAKVLGKKARERALVRHDKRTVVSDLLSIYNSVISQHSGNLK